MSPAALAISLGYGLAVLGILGRRRLRERWILPAVGAGAVAFPVALILTSPIQTLFATAFGWDMDAYSTSLRIGLIGIVAAATINEVFKLAAALLASSPAGEHGDALVFGAASGVGFGIVGAYQVIVLALVARSLPIGSPAGFTVSLAQQFAFVSVNAASTALAAYGTARRRIGPYLVVAILSQILFTALGLLFALRMYTSVVWTVLGLAVALLLLGYAFFLSLRPAATESPRAAS
jgi:hypothetical protein